MADRAKKKNGNGKKELKAKTAGKKGIWTRSMTQRVARAQAKEMASQGWQDMMGADEDAKPAKGKK
jgi:hypothetical protein